MRGSHWSLSRNRHTATVQCSKYPKAFSHLKLVKRFIFRPPLKHLCALVLFSVCPFCFSLSCLTDSLCLSVCRWVSPCLGLSLLITPQSRALADMNKDGKMDRLEFSIAMKLIKLKLQGTPLPSALPIIMKQPPVPAPTLNAAYGMACIPSIKSDNKRFLLAGFATIRIRHLKELTHKRTIGML